MDCLRTPSPSDRAETEGSQITAQLFVYLLLRVYIMLKLQITCKGTTKFQKLLHHVRRSVTKRHSCWRIDAGRLQEPATSISREEQWGDRWECFGYSKGKMWIHALMEPILISGPCTSSPKSTPFYHEYVDNTFLLNYENVRTTEQHIRNTHTQRTSNHKLRHSRLTVRASAMLLLTIV
jgi:hypothetical protein